MQQIVTDEIYDNPMVGIREMISNARDQYLDSSTESHQHYKEIYLGIDPLRRIITCEDYATGITDIEDFKLMGAKKASGGKVVSDQTSTRWLNCKAIREQTKES